MYILRENIAKIINERDRKLDELATLKGSSEKQIWLNELALLRKEYTKLKSSTNKTANTTSSASANTSKKTKVVKPKV